MPVAGLISISYDFYTSKAHKYMRWRSILRRRWPSFDLQAHMAQLLPMMRGVHTLKSVYKAEKFEKS